MALRAPDSRKDNDRRPARRGAVTGARIFRYLSDNGPSAARDIAADLDLDESYTRRTCNHLVAAGVLSAEEKAQVGTPPVAVFDAVKD